MMKRSKEQIITKREIKMRRFLNMIGVTLTALVINTQVFSQQSVDTATIMDEVTVTATKRSMNKSALPYSVELLTREESSRNLSRTVPESLAGIPGIFIQKTNHAGGAPFVRGLTGNQSLILVDGIRLNNSIFRYGPNQYLTLVDPFIVDRIEVVKGTGSVQYGSDAMTGVINIQTNSLKFREQALWREKATARITESGMELSVRPELKYEGKRFAFVVGASHKKFGDLKGGDTTGFQRPSGYGEHAFDIKLMADLGKSWTITSSYQWLRQQDVPVYHKYKLENYALNTSDPLTRGFGYMKLNKKFNRPFIKELDFFISNQFIEESRYIRKNSSQVLRSERDHISTISGGVDMLTAILSTWTANSGIEIYADRVESSRSERNVGGGSINSMRGLYPNGATYSNLAMYSLHHLNFGRLKLEGGLRYNFYQAKITDITLGRIRLKPSALVFQGGLNYQLTKGIHLYANISDGFRAPNIDDLGTLGIVDFRYEIPAYGLRPERSVNHEVGLKYFDSKFSGSLAVFRTNLFDLISRVKTAEVVSGYDVYKKINIDKGYIRGWEMQAAYQPLKQIRLHAAATSLFGQSITKDQPLRRIPPFNARLGSEYYITNYVFGIVFDYASAQRRLESGDKSDNRIPAGGTPGFNILNLHAGVTYRNMTIRTYLNNVFNQDYRTHGSGINGMGRAFSMMLVWQFNH
jgi:outer membrane receptor protein involved in Fe transport